MMKVSSISWSAKTLKNQIDKGNLQFDLFVQRGLVWDLERKSLLIDTMVRGYDIPSFYFQKLPEGKNYNAIDGKQRSTTIYAYMNNDFALSESIETFFDDDGQEVILAGMHFEELPENVQDLIKDYMMPIKLFADITEEEIIEQFYRINNGKPLSSIELTRVKAKSIKQFQKIANSNMIQFATTEKGKIKYQDENIAMQIFDICFNDASDFSTKSFRNKMEIAEVSEDEVEKMEKYLSLIYDFVDSLDDTNKEDKKIIGKAKRRTHLVSLCYMAQKTMDNNLSDSEFRHIAYKFFNCMKVTSISNDYNESVGRNSASPVSLAKRKASIDQEINFYIVSKTMAENS